MNDNREHMRLLLAARLSGKKTREGDIGITTQDARGRDWAEREGHTIVDVVADYKKGTVAPWDRPHLRPWVTRPDLMDKYDGILAYKNDRLSRGSWEDETRIRQWASENGKVLVIVDGPQWPPRDDGDFWAWTAQAKQANAEWEEIRERSMRAQRELSDRGMLVGRLPRWAYTSVGDKYNRQAIPTKEGQKYIRQIFQLVADGDSLATVAEWTRAEGVGSGKMSATSIHRTIRNRTYMGDHFYHIDGELRRLKVPPLVDASLWTRANERMKNAPAGRRKPTTGKSALLTSVLFCPRCPRGSQWAPMYRINAWGGYFYRCAGYYPERKGCGNMVDLDATDLFVAQLLSLASDPWKEPRLVEGENHDIELTEIQLQLDDLPKRKLPDVEEDAERARLREERNRLESLPNIPDRWKDVEVCGTCDGSEYLNTCEAAFHHKESVGEHWANLDYDGQRAMLKRGDVRVYAESPRTPELQKLLGSPLIRVESRLFRVPLESIQP